jgi:hypothetical protein
MKQQTAQQLRDALMTKYIYKNVDNFGDALTPDAAEIISEEYANLKLQEYKDGQIEFNELNSRCEGLTQEIKRLNVDRKEMLMNFMNHVQKNQAIFFIDKNELAETFLKSKI